MQSRPNVTESTKPYRPRSSPIPLDTGAGTPLEWRIQDDHFEVVDYSRNELHAPPSMCKATRLLSEDLGYSAGLSRIFGAETPEDYSRLFTIISARLSYHFLADSVYRDHALHELCTNLLESPGMLLIDPQEIMVRGTTRFLERRLLDQPLLLCWLFGSIGFAQVCDDLLGRPIPLLMRPWSPRDGLLHPSRPPRKSFSQHLWAARVGKRGLILLDKRCGAG